MIFKSKIVIVVLILCVILSLIMIFGPASKKILINGNVANKSNCEDLTKENQELKNRVKQLEATAESVIGEKPKENLHSITGIVLSERRKNDDLKIMEFIPLDLNRKDINLNEIDALFEIAEEGIINVEKSGETKFYTLPLPKGANSELKKSSDDLPVLYPCAALIQTENTDLKNQNKVQAYSITLYY